MDSTWTGGINDSLSLCSFQPMPNNRKSPSNDIRPPLTPLAGVYSTMVLPGKRAKTFSFNDFIN